MNIISDSLNKAANVDLSSSDLETLYRENHIDNQFMFFSKWLKAIAFLRHFVSQEKGDLGKLLDEAEENLYKQQNNILNFYSHIFPDSDFVGAFSGDEAPDCIVVLGANPGTAKERAEHAAYIANQYQSAIVIPSGGGSGTSQTEAQVMNKILVEEGISTDRILLETDSLDTIGNALFTKLLLKERSLLSHCVNILIVTSRFHVLRSINIFNRVFCSGHNIAASFVRTSDKKNDLKLASHEILSDSLAQETVFNFDISWGDNKNICLDDEALIFQLFTKHDLYKNRYDILRKFSSVIQFDG